MHMIAFPCPILSIRYFSRKFTFNMFTKINMSKFQNIIDDNHINVIMENNIG